jgi:ribosomal-protein-alanine N-acetyltransferase
MDKDVFDVFPEIDLGEIEMRQIVPEDIEHFYAYITNDAVKKFLSESDIPTSIENASKELMYWGRLFNIRSSVYWAIGLKSNGRIIGTGGFNYWNKEQKRTEISYDIAHDYWGKGYATAAVKAMVDFAFSKMKINRIQATVAIHNIASIKVLEKSGFKKEGLMSNYGVLEGESKDFYMYGKV